MKRMIIWGLIAMSSGCASPGVRCSGALRPINAPDLAVPVTHPATPKPPEPSRSGTESP